MVKVIILTGHGINAEKELAWAFEKAGGSPEIVHLEEVIENSSILKDYKILAFPGGFSFGDHIASGKVFANLIKYNLMGELMEFINSDKLVIGICNGFQIITKLGIVPDIDGRQTQSASLMENDSGHFEDRWVWVRNVNSNSPWLAGIERLYLPVRHGEGKFVTKDGQILDQIMSSGQAALRYFDPDNENTPYPCNPNGSAGDIAGILNKKGNVLGIMPHPEAYIFNENHPRWTERKISDEFTGLKIFSNAIDYFR